MKRIIAITLTIAVLATVGCSTRTQYGECIGVNNEPKPELKYKYDGWNIFLGVLFFQTIIVPIWVILYQHKCPTGLKNVQSH